jgi:hypothetical protein
MIRPDARYCSTCARNITGERAFVRGLLVAVAVLAGLILAGIALFITSR